MALYSPRTDVKASEDLDSLRLQDGSLVHHCQKVYRAEMQRLRWRHSNGEDGPAIAVARAALVDQLVQIASRSALLQLPVAGGPARSSWRNAALIALGEYGRLELAPHSPVEMLLLIKSHAVPEACKELEITVRAVLDSLGCEVQLLVLTPKQCLQQAEDHFPFSFACLQARWLSGQLTLFEDWKQRFWANLCKNRLAFLADIAGYMDGVHKRSKSGVYRTEPDLESGVGGLMDLAAFHGCLKVMTGRNDPLLRPVDGRLSPRDWQRLQEARQHLILVRNHLHFAEGGRQDRLLSQHAPRIAQLLFGRVRDPDLATAFLVRDTARRRRDVHHIVTCFLQQAQLDVSAHFERAKVGYLKLAEPESPNRSSGKEASPQPERWMKLFRLGQSDPTLFGNELQTALLDQFAGRRLNVVGSPAMHAEFRLILKQKGRVGNVLRRMRETGFLGRYLPEVGRLDCMPQHTPGRTHTIDEIVFRSIDVLDEVATLPGPLMHDYQRVLDQVADASLIYLGLLLRCSGSFLDSRRAPRHEPIAACALRRLNVEAEGQEKVLLLVREQRLLAEVSQRRDLDDPFILQEVCDSVESADNLNMLLLLTYASLQSSEEEGWNERKDFLLWSLYFKVFDRLMFGDEISEPEYAQAAKIQQHALEQLGSEFQTETVLRHFQLLPEKYALYTPLTQIVSQVRLCEKLQDQPVVTLWTPHPRACYTELVLSTHDLPGRFAQIAGTLSSQNISILSAQLNTRDDGVVIDTFQISDAQGQAIVDAEVWRHVDRLLAAVISGEQDLNELLALGRKDTEGSSPGLATPRLRIDNEIASQSTVIEVQASDRPGLGYRVARALADLGLNILSAKLATEHNHAFAVFYVQTREGEKVTSSFQMTEVLERLRSALA